MSSGLFWWLSCSAKLANNARASLDSIIAILTSFVGLNRLAVAGFPMLCPGPGHKLGPMAGQKPEKDKEKLERIADQLFEEQAKKPPYGALVVVAILTIVTLGIWFYVFAVFTARS
jgi:hypothetical protein